MLMPLRAQIGYASGNLGKSLMWTSLEYLLLFYLTDLVGIPPRTAGLMILVSLAWDGAINPLIGYWLDLRAGKGKDYRPLLLWAPPVAALLFVGIFFQPFVETGWATAYFFAILVAFRSAYALLDVPHNGLLALLPVDSPTRTSLAGYRYFFSSLGGLLVALAAAPLVIAADDGRSVSDIRAVAALAGVALCATVWQSLRPAQLALVLRGPVTLSMSPRRFLLAIGKSCPAMLYLGMAAVFACTTPLFGKMLPFLAAYVHNDSASVGRMLALMTVGQMLSMLICPRLAQRFGRLPVGIVCLLGIPTLLLAARMEMSINASQFWLVSGSFGFLLGGAIMVIWATAGDIAEQIAISSGVRTDAGLFSFLTLVQKTAIGAGAMLAGALLENGSFQPGSPQAQAALANILTLGFVIPSIGAAVSAAMLFWLYRIAYLDRL